MMQFRSGLDLPVAVSSILTAILSVMTSYPPVTLGRAPAITIRAGGASFPASVYEAWTESYRSFRNPHRDVDIRYEGIGSSQGIQAILADTNYFDFAGSDSLLSAAQTTARPDLAMFPSLAG